MIISVGSTSSAGSTLLADLFDSVPGFACGIELNMFSNRMMFNDFDRFKKDIEIGYQTAAMDKDKVNINYHRLESFNTTEAELKDMIRNSQNVHDFIYKFKSEYLSFRGEDKQVWVEKTPKNIHAAEPFLNTFEDGYFVHVIRDPRFVYNSIHLHRNRPRYISASSWVLDNSSGFQIRNNPRYICVRYEDLVKRPFQLVSEIVEGLGFDADEETIEKRYRNNTYRMKYSKKNVKWSVKKFGTIKNANDEKKLRGMEGHYPHIFGLKVNKKYGLIHGLPEVSYKTLCDEYDYTVETSSTRSIFDPKSRMALFRKFRSDHRTGDVKLSDLIPYLTPTVTS